MFGAGRVAAQEPALVFGRNVQLDLEVDRGVTSEEADWFIGFGVAVRTRMF